MIDVAVAQLAQHCCGHGFVFRAGDKSQGVDELVPAQGEGKNAGDGQGQHDLDQDLGTGGAVDQSAFFQLVGDRFEIAHQQPGGKRDQNGGVGQRGARGHPLDKLYEVKRNGHGFFRGQMAGVISS